MGRRTLIICCALVFSVIIACGNGAPLPSNMFSPTEYDEEVLVPVEIVYEEPSFVIPHQGRADDEDMVEAKVQNDEEEDDDDDDDDNEDNDEDEKDLDDKEDADEDEEDKDDVDEDDDDDDDDDDKSEEAEDDSDKPKEPQDDPGSDEVQLEPTRTPGPLPVHVPHLLDEKQVSALSSDPKGAVDPVVAIPSSSVSTLADHQTENFVETESEPPRQERLLYIHPNTKFGWHGTWEKPVFERGNHYQHNQHQQQHGHGHGGSGHPITYHHGFYTSLY